MMWACAQYAVPLPYLRSAAKEVKDQTRRLQHRPSIVLWAGNNENERDLTKQYEDLQKPYADLYFRTVLSNVTALDSSRPTSGSSPSCGNETADHPFCANHQTEYYGDVHCYLYDVDNWDVTAYKRPRFMSEFGLQSWPAAITMAETIKDPQQWTWDSPLMQSRNHHPDGQMQILQQISMHFHLPAGPAAWKPHTDGQQLKYWRQMLWMTQVNQAVGYKVEVEHFRRIRSECSATLPGCNMGRMYWQTNDIWPGASWAAIDFTGRYKMVQHYTKKFYAPLLVSAYCVHWRDCHVYFINDDPNDGIAAGQGKITLALHSWAEGKLKEWTVPFASAPASASPVWNTSFDGLLAKGGCEDATECVLTMSAYNGSTLVSTNDLFLAPFFDVTTMNNPHLTVKSLEALTQLDARGVIDATVL